MRRTVKEVRRILIRRFAERGSRVGKARHKALPTVAVKPEMASMGTAHREQDAA